MQRILLGSVVAVGLFATVSVAGSVHASETGLRTIEVSTFNGTTGNLTVQDNSVYSGEWVSGQEPEIGANLAPQSTMQVGVTNTQVGQSASGMLILTGEGAPLSVAMAAPWSGSPSVHAVSTSSLLTTVTQAAGSNPQNGNFNLSLASTSPGGTALRAAVAQGLRGSMRVTIDNRTDEQLSVSDFVESKTLDWRGRGPSVSEIIGDTQSWRFANIDARGDAGVIMTLTGTDDARVILAASMRADGSRSADVIHAEGVNAAVAHSPTTGWRVIITPA